MMMLKCLEMSLKVARMETRGQVLSRTREHFFPNQQEKRYRKKKYAEKRELSLSLSEKKRGFVFSSSSSSSFCAMNTRSFLVRAKISDDDDSKDPLLFDCFSK